MFSQCRWQNPSLCEVDSDRHQDNRELAPDCSNRYFDIECLPRFTSSNSFLPNPECEKGISMLGEKPTYLSLFSGCGGFDLGFQQGGFRSLGAFDIDSAAVSVHQHNVRGKCHRADLQSASITTREFGCPDIVISGSPCQGFSSLGRRKQNDPRNRLLWRGAEIAVGLKPEIIVLENVTGVLTSGLRCHFEKAIAILENAGYETSTLRITCSDFGLPQIRKRVLLIASHNTSNDIKLRQRHARTLGDCLTGIHSCTNHEPIVLQKNTDEFRIANQIGQHQKLCNVRGGDRAVPTWEIPEVFGRTTRIERQVLIAMRQLRRQVRERGDGDADPLKLSTIKKQCGDHTDAVIKSLVEKRFIRQIGRRFDLAHTFNGKYRRLSVAHPSPAVDTRFGTPRYFLHPEENRGFSVREAARIQGFPDSFTFEGPPSTQFRLVGNAVPPPVAKAIAVALKEQLG